MRGCRNETEPSKDARRGPGGPPHSMSLAHRSAALLLLALWLVGCEPSGKPAAPQKEVADFQTLFRDNCSGCHERLGRGTGTHFERRLIPGIYPQGKFAGASIEHGRAGTAMPAWARAEGGPLTSEQISALVDGMERNWAKTVNLHGR